ncbi:D-hexose-6-phosphate mutarotase [Magnetospira thiophila]
MTIDQLNTDFGIAGKLTLVEGPGGLTMLDVSTALATARVSPYAGQVLAYRPTGQTEDLLFLSQQAYYAPGKAIKGGLPVCWPWFGPDPDGLGRPGHGFVRNRAWSLLSTAERPDGTIEIRLGLSDTEETRAIWPHSFELELRAIIGATLEVALITRNRGTEAFPLTQALHSYFRVGDIAQARVLGLEGCTYIDKMDNSTEKPQAGAVTISGETDRIYTGVGPHLSIEDQALGRTLALTSQGSASAVVWNPWAATAQAMADLGDDDYKSMLCVETTNAGPDVVTVAPGGEHVMQVAIAVK